MTQAKYVSVGQEVPAIALCSSHNEEPDDIFQSQRSASCHHSAVKNNQITFVPTPKIQNENICKCATSLWPVLCYNDCVQNEDAYFGLLQHSCM